MDIKRLIKLILILVLLLPLWLWLAWLFTPSKVLETAIIDKTVLTTQGQEHASISWLLNNNRFSKSSEKRYDPSNDYFGFFPEKDYKYQIKGLERLDKTQIQQLSADADLVYYTDTYGIYSNEWYSAKQNKERSGMVYGGMSEQDITFLQEMKARHKLIISEFNTIGSPTSELVRNKFEKLFGLHWTGWTARYFPLLDTAKNNELPHWLISNYKDDHRGSWPFKKAGIAFVSLAGKVVILEEGEGVTDAMTYIFSRKEHSSQLDLPDSVQYPFWFDLIVPDQKLNTIAANFVIKTTVKGKAELQKNGIPLEIPAVVFHKKADYQFYYFSGDFCDNPVSMWTSHFKAIDFFSFLFYRSDNKEDRNAFFWKWYNPMMRQVLNDYYENSMQAKK